MLGARQAIRQRQLRAIRASTAPCDSIFNELCRQLLSFRDFNLRVVAVAPFEGNFIIVTQNQVQGILKFLRIANWRFEAVPHYVHLSQSQTEQWQQFQSIYRSHWSLFIINQKLSDRKRLSNKHIRNSMHNFKSSVLAAANTSSCFSSTYNLFSKETALPSLPSRRQK